MNYEFIKDEEIETTRKILRESLKRPKILDEFSAFMFSRDIDLDKQILIYLNRGTNNNGVGYWQILYWLIKRGYMVYEGAEKRLDRRLISLEKYDLITKIYIEPLKERFYKIKKNEQ